MNLFPQLVHRLRSHHHDAVHWSDIGDPRTDDREIMAWAAENGYVVLTHDLDFGALPASLTRTKPSVIQVRTRDLLSEQYFKTLTDALSRFGQELEKSALVVVDPGRAKERIPPLG